MPKLQIVGVFAVTLASASAFAADDGALPSPEQIASCVVGVKPPHAGLWRPPEVTCKDVLAFLATAKVVSKDSWLRNYSHVAMADYTGTITLQTGETVLWLMRPGGLGSLKFQRGAELFLIRCFEK
jgi:hypothetical protein